jgi:hypothetical protein
MFTFLRSLLFILAPLVFFYLRRKNKKIKRGNKKSFLSDIDKEKIIEGKIVG